MNIKLFSILFYIIVFYFSPAQSQSKLSFSQASPVYGDFTFFKGEEFFFQNPILRDQVYVQKSTGISLGLTQKTFKYKFSYINSYSDGVGLQKDFLLIGYEKLIFKNKQSELFYSLLGGYGSANFKTNFESTYLPSLHSQLGLSFKLRKNFNLVFVFQGNYFHYKKGELLSPWFSTDLSVGLRYNFGPSMPAKKPEAEKEEQEEDKLEDPVIPVKEEEIKPLENNQILKNMNIQDTLPQAEPSTPEFKKDEMKKNELKKNEILKNEIILNEIQKNEIQQNQSQDDKNQNDKIPKSKDPKNKAKPKNKDDKEKKGNPKDKSEAKKEAKSLKFKKRLEKLSEKARNLLIDSIWMDEFGGFSLKLKLNINNLTSKDKSDLSIFYEIASVFPGGKWSFVFSCSENEKESCKKNKIQKIQELIPLNFNNSQNSTTEFNKDNLSYEYYEP
jgi:hypothetical protein